MTTRIIVGVVTVICTLLLLWFLERREAHSEARSSLPACPESAEDSQKIRRMMARGFESAFTQQIGQLYKVYTGNAPSVEQQRSYTKKGMENAIAAYRIAISAVDAWEC